MIVSNISSVTKAIDKKIDKVDTNVMAARDEMMARLIQLAQNEIQDERGVVARKISNHGKIYNYKQDPAISGQPPKNRTGNLRRSIIGKKAREGFASYSAIVGPTVIYGRAVELGGAPTWTNGQHFPYMAPALQKFQREAIAIIRKHLGQEGHHMAEFLPPVIFEIQANAKEAIAQMQVVNGELTKMEAKAIKAGGSIDVMTKASKYAGTALLGIAGVLGTVAAVSIKAALNVQVSQSKLQVAVQNTGVSFAAFIPYMNQAQESMAKFGYGAEDTNQALATMTAATRNPSVAIANLGVVADLAAFKNESLAAAADTVSRATMGQARGLADLGLAIGKTIPKGADLSTIMKMIEDRVKGSATAAAKADPWKVLTTQFQVMAEQLGTKLLPAFERITTWITTKGIKDLESLGKWISDNKGLFETLAGTLAAIWVVPKIAGLLEALETIKGAFTGVTVAAEGATVAETTAMGGLFAPVTAAALGAIGFNKTIGAPLTKAMASGGSLSMKGAIGAIESKGKVGDATTQNKAMKQKQDYWVMDSNGNLVNIGGGGVKGSTSSPNPSSINSGLKPNIITPPTKTKATSSKGLTAAQQKAGIMGGGGALTLTITTSNGAIVNSITGSAGHTKVLVKKGK